MIKKDLNKDPGLVKLKSYKGNFRCAWGDEIYSEFLSIHMNDCDKMQDSYGELYNSLNILIEDSPFPETWNNIQALTSFFRIKLDKIINEVSLSIIRFELLIR